MVASPGCSSGLLRRDSRELTIDLQRHSEAELASLGKDLESKTRLRKLKLKSKVPTKLLSYALTVEDLTLYDRSDNDDVNSQQIVRLSSVQRLAMMLGSDSYGHVFENYRFPTITHLEIVVNSTVGDHPDSVCNWTRCLAYSYCISELRIMCDAKDLLQLPDHVSGSISKLVYAPSDDEYGSPDFVRVTSKFPYLEELCLYAGNGELATSAKSAARLLTAKNPVLEVSYFNRHSQYFTTVAELTMSCGCSQHFVFERRGSAASVIA